MGYKKTQLAIISWEPHSGSKQSTELHGMIYYFHCYRSSKILHDLRYRLYEFGIPVSQRRTDLVGAVQKSSSLAFGCDAF